MVFSKHQRAQLFHSNSSFIGYVFIGAGVSFVGYVFIGAGVSSFVGYVFIGAGVSSFSVF